MDGLGINKVCVPTTTTYPKTMIVYYMPTFWKQQMYAYGI